jgi:EAL domain-containing protein (putative c-di-GMP-specific phosphodiesterase class I)
MLTTVPDQPLPDLLAEQSIQVHFQPIISLKQKAIVGLEALARPFASDPQKKISVPELFLLAHAHGWLLVLDRHLRSLAMERYHGLIMPQDPRPLLFINFESSLIDQGVQGSGHILQAVQDAGLEPGDIVIEVNESRVHDLGALRRFVDFYRDHGFLIALDDLGAGHSNLPRVADLKPHIVKVDRSLIQNIDQDFHKQETFKTLVSLGAKTGCMVLAEGVETQAEVDCCAGLGASLFQGFYFARPMAPDKLDFQGIQPGLAAAARRQRYTAVQTIHERRLEAHRLRRLSEAAKHLLMQADPTGFDMVLSRLVRNDFNVECAYLLDKDGLQVSATHTNPNAPAARNRLFAPAPKGADHSAKEYFFSLLDAGLERYTTETYLSLATGNPCRTVSCLVPRSDGTKYVLCMDLRSNTGGH